MGDVTDLAFLNHIARLDTGALSGFGLWWRGRYWQGHRGKRGGIKLTSPPPGGRLPTQYQEPRRG